MGIDMIRILYDENNPDYKTTYKGVQTDGNLFYTGDVVKDFIDAMQRDYAKNGMILLSSSCDHFVHDVPGFGWIETIITGYIR